MRGRKNKGEGFIVEFIPQGHYVKVSAIDPVSGREVSIVGDPKKSERELQEVAVRKLLYVLGKGEKKGKSKFDELL